jgi:large subunit ribosomal protein L25
MAKIESNMIEAKPRQADGKNVARRARRAGQLPAVVYGARKEPVTVALDPKKIARILHSETGHNTILDLQLEGERTKAMIVDWQYEPLKGSLLHVDLKRIAMDQLLRVKVPIHLKGEAPGVKQQGGIMEQVLREVELECLPADIPSHIDADVSGLLFNQVLRVADLSNNEGRLRLLSDGNQVVAHIVTVKEVVEATPDAAAAEAGAAAEPEVIKKGKQDEEGTAAAEKK